ncbi:tRNA pseudouridine synthase, partial [Thraustotheca clavata]
MVTKLLEALPTDPAIAGALFTAYEGGMCIRCCMRFFGLCNDQLYWLNIDQLNETWNAFATKHQRNLSIHSKEAICNCCLNVFEVLLSGVNILRELIVAGGYQTSTFLIAMKIPSSILIRQYSIVQNLPVKLNPVDLKEVLKWCITPIFAQALGNATYTTSSDVTLNLHFGHPQSEAEAMQLPTLRDTIMQNKKRKLDIDGYGAVSRALSKLSVMPTSIAYPPPSVTTPVTMLLNIERAPIYVAGRYLKYQRG